MVGGDNAVVVEELLCWMDELFLVVDYGEEWVKGVLAG